MNLAEAFQFSSSLVAIMDAADGRIVDVNAAFEKATGYRRADLTGKRSVDFGFWPSLETRARIWAHLRSERCVRGERVVFRVGDGSLRQAMLYCEMFAQDGANLVLAVFQDVQPAASAQVTADDPGSYRALFLAAAEGLYRSLPDGGWIDVNPALARIFGYASPVEMLSETRGHRASELYADPEQAARLRARLAAEGHYEQQRARVRRRDGSLVWISENARAVCDERGQVLFYEGSVIDITAQLEAEQRMRQSEALYKTLVDNCRDGVFLILHDRILFANQALADMLGYTVEELRDRPYWQLVAPESLAEQQARRRARTDGSRASQDYEVLAVCRDGSRRLLRIRAAAVPFDGEVAATGTVQDITEERRQQQALREAEQKYRALFENSVMGMFQSHPDGRLLEANDAMAEILGYTDATALKTAIAHMAEIYADPSERQHLLDHLLAHGRIRNERFAARRRDGSVALIEINAQLVRDARGAVLYIEGSAQDVTARHAAEQALKHSEARYRTLVEHSQVGVYLMLDDRYTYVNRTFATMFGYAEHELIGADFRVLVPPESLAQQEDRYQRQVRGETNRGDYDVVLQCKDGSRIEVVVSAGTVEMDGRAYTCGTIRDVTAQRRIQRQLEHNASHDLLTGLPNRAQFERELADAIAERRRRGEYDYAVLFLDLDGFKLVNDCFGHASGDVLLVQIAECLRRHLGEECRVARYGGDEFTLLPYGSCPRSRAEQLAQRVLGLLAGSFEVHGHRVFSSASLGVVLGRAEYESPEQILRDADTAMYRAKASGKSAYVIFDDAMHAAARARLKIETELRFALERGEFRVFYQPIVDLDRKQICGCEALLRWQHPERGLLLPADFLHVAEETGALVAIDWWVLEHTCRNLLRWQKRFAAHAELQVSVNVDERQFAEPNLIGMLRDVLHRSGVDPARLTLEITETVFRRGRTEAEARLRALHELGVSLVVDDFGTGYSSLDSFATAPFDALKVDQSFVRDMVTNFRHRAIVRTIGRFAEELGLDWIAEGVEQPEQGDLLGELGCDGAQGLLFAPPLPLDAFEQVLERGLGGQGRAAANAVA